MLHDTFIEDGLLCTLSASPQSCKADYKDLRYCVDCMKVVVIDRILSLLYLSVVLR